MDLDAAHESVVPVSTQNMPPLYQLPYFTWLQLPEVHAPMMDDYLSFQSGTLADVSAPGVIRTVNLLIP